MKKIYKTVDSIRKKIFFVELGNHDDFYYKFKKSEEEKSESKNLIYIKKCFLIKKSKSEDKHYLYCDGDVFDIKYYCEKLSRTLGHQKDQIYLFHYQLPEFEGESGYFYNVKLSHLDKKISIEVKNCLLKILHNAGRTEYRGNFFKKIFLDELDQFIQILTDPESYPSKELLSEKNKRIDITLSMKTSRSDSYIIEGVNKNCKSISWDELCLLSLNSLKKSLIFIID